MIARHATTVVALVAALVITANGQEPQDREVFRFRTGVELINVTATVTDVNGRFVSGLRKEDFQLFEDGQEQTITHFNAERVPVSLGLVVDTSGSMEGEKWVAARQALNRFLFQLLDRNDEVFLYRFDNQPELIEGWTTDRERIATGLARIRPRGATSLYDAVAAAVPLAQTGRHRKKAIVVISDGNDTNSRATVREIKSMIRSTEVLAYAIGIDSQGTASPWGTQSGPSYPPPQGPRVPIPLPFPYPGRSGPRTQPPPHPMPSPPQGSGGARSRMDERVNVAALRDITDESGGRTEIIRYARDLDPATTSVADELSKQYYLGYSSQARKDGQWHTIRVEVRDGRNLVRARKGYVAVP
ncbi:MAG: VWA domain-containing protein [Vicinamibacterales bacterium]